MAKSPDASDDETMGLVRAHVGLVAGEAPILRQLGLAAWSVIGIIGLVALLIVGLATISSVVFPLLFAMVMAVLFQPLAAKLIARRVPASLAAGVVVVGLVAAVVGVLVLTVVGVIDQSGEIVNEVSSSLEELDIKVDDSTLDDLQTSIENADPSMTSGVVKGVTKGLSAVGAFLVGALLGLLIMYYLIKDGPALRRALVARTAPNQAENLNDFITETCFVLRRYWLGRSIISAIVSAVVALAALLLGLPLVMTIAVVTFVGGFIPYVGAVAGGLLAVVVALGSDGVVAAVIMLVVVLVANLLIENLIEPAVTGRTLKIHPLIVLLATTVGGVVGGMIGLVMGVPLTVIGAKAIPRIARALEIKTAEEAPGASAAEQAVLREHSDAAESAGPEPLPTD